MCATFKRRFSSCRSSASKREVNIRTAHLTLEDLTPAHAEALFEGLQDDDLYAFIDGFPPKTLAEVSERCERLSRHRSPDGSEIWLNWAIHAAQDARMVGYVQATIGKRGVASIAYVLFRGARGRGVAREAVAGMIRHLRECHGIAEFFATVDPRNSRSIRLLEATGFARTEFQAGAAQIRGIVADESRYTLSFPEWPQ